MNEIKTEIETIIQEIKYYICPECAKRLTSEHEAIRCLQRHSSPKGKYKVGDVVKFLHYPQDHGEYDNGVITSLHWAYGRDEYFYYIENACDDVSEENIMKLIMTAEHRAELLAKKKEIFEKLPKEINWEIYWCDFSCTYKFREK